MIDFESISNATASKLWVADEQQSGVLPELAVLVRTGDPFRADDWESVHSPDVEIIDSEDYFGPLRNIQRITIQEVRLASRRALKVSQQGQGQLDIGVE